MHIIFLYCLFSAEKNSVNSDSFLFHFQSYSRGGYYIVTQTPLVNTVVDFWRLLFDHECKTIVSLNLLDEEQEVSI